MLTSNPPARAFEGVNGRGNNPSQQHCVVFVAVRYTYLGHAACASGCRRLRRFAVVVTRSGYLCFHDARVPISYFIDIRTSSSWWCVFPSAGNWVSRAVAVRKSSANVQLGVDFRLILCLFRTWDQVVSMKAMQPFIATPQS